MKKEAYKHDFSGQFKPINGMGIFTSQETFSVGIFQWLPKSSGSGLKQSAVKYRVRGYVSNADAVYSRAEEICSMMDNGKWVSTKKTEMVK